MEDNNADKATQRCCTGGEECKHAVRSCGLVCRNNIDEPATRGYADQQRHVPECKSSTLGCGSLRSRNVVIVCTGSRKKRLHSIAQVQLHSVTAEVQARFTAICSVAPVIACPIAIGPYTPSNANNLLVDAAKVQRPKACNAKPSGSARTGPIISMAGPIITV
eukprot:SAG31_NODE_77_length_27533_cov_47.448859_18_plen_163_part_00